MLQKLPLAGAFLREPRVVILEEVFFAVTEKSNEPVVS